jgi:Right handed beta helix region
MSAKLGLHAAPARLVSVAVVLALAAAGLVALSSASTARSRAPRRSVDAAAKQPKCGDTITTDVTLHHDLVDCPNNGILIGADDVTLDLNGHTIDGDGTPTAGCDPQTEFCDTGVANDGHDGVTATHGSMRQLDAGVNFFQVRHNRLLGISPSRNRDVGIQLFGSSRSLIRNSSGTHSFRPHDGTGLVLFDSDHVRVVHNSFRHNARRGIGVIGGTRNLVRGNHIRGAGRDGVLVDVDAQHTLLRGNHASGAKDDGFDVRSRTTKLTGNRAVRNHALGIHAVRGVIDGGGNVAHHNGDPRQCTHIVCN